MYTLYTGYICFQISLPFFQEDTPPTHFFLSPSGLLPFFENLTHWVQLVLPAGMLIDVDDLILYS